MRDPCRSRLGEPILPSTGALGTSPSDAGAHVGAARALAAARDPAVPIALARIEADERRRAELGWGFVTWAVRAGGASVPAV